jgi:hypothetical protein
MRRERRGLGARYESRGSRGDTEGDLEKIPAFHDNSLISRRAMRRNCCRGDMNTR